LQKVCLTRINCAEQGFRYQLIDSLDFRRYFRPFFLDPVTSQPTHYKIYYDIFSYLATQLAFSFVTAPFVLLTLRESWLVWSRVYFYAIFGTALSTAFFASPAKEFLKKKLEERTAKVGGHIKRTLSQESVAGQQPVMGLPPESLDEAVKEIREEIEAIQRKGLAKGEIL
jgi:lysophospholipid acyltransferase